MSRFVILSRTVDGVAQPIMFSLANIVAVWPANGGGSCVSVTNDVGENAIPWLVIEGFEQIISQFPRDFMFGGAA